MGNKILALNHKMNLLPKDLSEYINNIDIANKNLIVFPMSIYLPYFINKGFSVGVQNINHNDSGAFTGEIGALHSHLLGADYTLIGHSERRHIMNETSDLVNKKLHQALKSNLKVILCIGELTNDSQKEEVIKKEIDESLKDVLFNENIIIAYEPVWAIGTGLVPTNQEIESSIDFIKKEIENKFSYIPKVLYGGSVNEKNIEEINNISNVDGFLVGGASLDYKKVLKMIKVVL